MNSTGQATDAATSLASIVGANIRRARDARKLTQRELAALVGGKTDDQRISDWERGVYRPQDSSLAQVALALGHDLPWFFVDRGPFENGKAAA